MSSSAEIRMVFAPVEEPRDQADVFMQWAWYFFGNDAFPSYKLLRVSSPQMHWDMAEFVSHRYLYSLITAPRGVAKTTMFARLWPLYNIVYELEPFIEVIGADDTAGAKNMRSIRNALADHQGLIDVYGDLLPSRGKVGKVKMADNDNELSLVNGVVLRSVGITGRIRGEVDRFRPTLFIIEDPQSKKTMREPSSLERHKQIYEYDIDYAKDPEYGKILVIGNDLGPGCLVNTLSRHSEYHTMAFDMYDASGKSVWESMFPTARLKAEEADALKNGTLSVFYSERRNIPDAASQKKLSHKFHDCSLRRINDQNFLVSDVYPHPLKVNVFAAVDPAYSDVKTSDQRARVIGAVGQFPLPSDNGTYRYRRGLWILHYEADYADPSKLPDWVMEVSEKYSIDGLVVEANGGQLLNKYLIENGLVDNPAYTRNPFSRKFIRYVSESKESRIWNRFSLMCNYGQFFIRPEMTELAHEMTYFGILILQRKVHILDAIEMGDTNTVAPEVVTDLNEQIVYDHKPGAYNQTQWDKVYNSSKGFMVW